MQTITPCSHRCEAEDPLLDTVDGSEHQDCPDPALVCSLEGCVNDKYEDEEHCRQCDYEMGFDAAADAHIDAAMDGVA